MTYFQMFRETRRQLKNGEFTTIPTTLTASRHPIYRFQLFLARSAADLTSIGEHHEYAFNQLRVAYFENVLNLEEEFMASLYIAMLALECMVHPPEEQLLQSISYLVECVPVEYRDRFDAKYQILMRKRNKHRTHRAKSPATSKRH